MKRYIIYYRQWSKKSRSRVELAAQEAEAKRFVAYNAGQGKGCLFRGEGRPSNPASHRTGGVGQSHRTAIRAEAVLVIAHLGRLVKNAAGHAGLAEQQC